MSAVADVLNHAADLIERDGWAQGSYHTECGYCIAGAIDETLGILDRRDDNAAGRARFEQNWPVAEEARRVVEHTVHSSPTIWNDQPCRTQAEVVAALRAAAERAA